MMTRNVSIAAAVSMLGCQPITDFDQATRGAPMTSVVVETPSSTEDTRAELTSESTAPVGPSTVGVAPVTVVLPTGADASSASQTRPNETTSAANGNSDESSEGSTTGGASEITAEGTFEDSTPTAASSSEGVTSDEPTMCSAQCAMGDVCTAPATCLSWRCDEVCQPMQFRVESNGLDAVSTSVKVHVELYADPSVQVAWRELAVLYFITVEKRDDFVLNFAEGGGTALPMQVGLTDWIVVWTTDASGNVPNTVTPFDVQFRSDPWLPDTPESNDNSNDHSYRSGLGPNDNIVLCRKVNDVWKHVQGTPPQDIVDPCQYVNNCDAALACDPL